MDDEWNWAGTYVEMEDGRLLTLQEALAGDGAEVDQFSLVDAWWAEAGSEAEDAEGNEAETEVEMEDGFLITDQGASADDGAR